MNAIKTDLFGEAQRRERLAHVARVRRDVDNHQRLAVAAEIRLQQTRQLCVVEYADDSVKRKSMHNNALQSTLLLR